MTARGLLLWKKCLIFHHDSELVFLFFFWLAFEILSNFWNTVFFTVSQKQMNMIWTKFQSTDNHFVFYCYSEKWFLTSLFNNNIPNYITSVFRRELKMEVTFAKAMAIFVKFYCIPPFSRSFTLPDCLFVREVLETLSHTYYGVMFKNVGTNSSPPSKGGGFLIPLN
jgi:hypothetical protein